MSMLVSEAFKRKPRKVNAKQRTAVYSKPLPRPGCYWVCGSDPGQAGVCSCEKIKESIVKVSEQFSGNYFKAADLPNPKVLTIQAVSQVELEGDKKIAIQFAGEQLQLIANKTNALTIAGFYGDDTVTWPGKQVELYSTQTNFAGRMVPCIRVRQPAAVEQAPWDGPQQPPVQPQPPVQQQPIQAPSFPIDA